MQLKTKQNYIHIPSQTSKEISIDKTEYLSSNATN